MESWEKLDFRGGDVLIKIFNSFNLFFDNLVLGF